jgi:hypothetical protein
MISVITEELLANVERVYLRARAGGETALGVYHEEAEFPRLDQRKLPTEETTKWPIG